MGVIIGGPKAWKTRRHGEIGVSFQWVNDEPAMIIFNANRSAGAAVIICLSAAYKYADSRTGEPTQYLIQKADEAARFLGLDSALSFAIRKIADVIADSLPDLVAMPNEPAQFRDERKPGAGEMAIKIDGETVMEAEV